MAEQQQLNMTVNHLPSLTWNRLGLNFAGVEGSFPAMKDAAFSEANTESVERTTISVKEAQKLDARYGGGVRREKYIAGKIAVYDEQDMSTGLGAEFDDYLDSQNLTSEVYKISSGQKLKNPIVLDWNFGAGASQAARQWIVLEDDAEATFVLNYHSDRDAGGLAAVSTKVYVGKNAKLNLIKVNMLGSGFLHLDDTGASVDDSGVFDFRQMELGASKSYVGAYADQVGRKSVFNINAGYLCRQDQKLDVNYVAAQRGEKTESTQAVKGVLMDQAEKCFRGTIDFRNGSSGSVGDEQEDVLLLDPDVVNKTIPVILCEEEDVEGRHGATIGRLSEDMLFYLETRGIDEEDAQKMMTQGRLYSVAREIPDEAVRKTIDNFIEEAFD